MRAKPPGLPLGEDECLAGMIGEAITKLTACTDDYDDRFQEILHSLSWVKLRLEEGFDPATGVRKCR
jgi:hypothetical protein